MAAARKPARTKIDTTSPRKQRSIDVIKERIRQQTKTDSEDDDDDGPAPEHPRRMLSETEVLALVPLSRTSIWRLQRAGKFPAATYVSANKRIWFEDQIVRWQREVDEFNPHRRRGPGRPKKHRRAARDQASGS